MKKGRGYSVEYQEGHNPFSLSDEDEKEFFRTREDPTNRTWDWNYEEHAFYVKESTIKNFSSILDLVVKNRDIMGDSSMCLLIDIPNCSKSIDTLFARFLHMWFSRMMKLSKVIQDLALQGSYVESMSLLRNNFETGLLIRYFVKNIAELRKYLSARNNNDKALLGRYKIDKLSKALDVDYSIYAHYCGYVHPNPHPEDIQPIRFGNEFGIIAHPYNDFNMESFLDIICSSHEILLDAFDALFGYLKPHIPDEDMKNPNILEILDNIASLKHIDEKLLIDWGYISNSNSELRAGNDKNKHSVS